MKRVMVRYRVKPDRVEENVTKVRAVYDELAQTKPVGLRYATFRLPDGVSFIHFAEVDGDTNPLQQVAAFKAFSANIAERCDEPPAPFDLTEVASYRWNRD